MVRPDRARMRSTPTDPGLGDCRGVQVSGPVHYLADMLREAAERCEDEHDRRSYLYEARQIDEDPLGVAYRMAQFWYRHEVGGIAREVERRCREEGADVSDAMHEECDGAGCVIYTRENYGVMMASQECAWDLWGENYGHEGAPSSPMHAAYVLLHEDVSNAVECDACESEDDND